MLLLFKHRIASLSSSVTVLLCFNKDIAYNKDVNRMKKKTLWLDVLKDLTAPIF